MVDDLGQPPRAPEPGDSNGLALAAMIIGIIGMLLALIPIIGFISWVLAPLAIVLGVVGLQKTTGKGFAWTGIITGGLGLLICITWAVLFASAGSVVEEMQRDLEREGFYDQK